MCSLSRAASTPRLLASPSEQEPGPPGGSSGCCTARRAGQRAAADVRTPGSAWQRGKMRACAPKEGWGRQTGTRCAWPQRPHPRPLVSRLGGGSSPEGFGRLRQAQPVADVYPDCSAVKQPRHLVQRLPAARRRSAEALRAPVRRTPGAHCQPDDCGLGWAAQQGSAAPTAAPFPTHTTTHIRTHTHAHTHHHHQQYHHTPPEYSRVSLLVGSPAAGRRTDRNGQAGRAM